MEEKILEFGRLLRKGGLDISFSQIADALRAVKEVGFNRENFYLALNCTLVNVHADLPLFNKIFRLYFLTLPTNDHINPGELHESDDHSQDTVSAELVQTAEGMGMGKGGGASPALLLVKAVRQENYPLLRQLGETAIKSLGRLERKDVGNIVNLIVQAKVAIGWFEAVNRLERTKTLEGISEITYARWLACLDYLEKYLNELLEDFFVRTFGEDALEEMVADANLKEKEFYRLTNLEIDEIRKRITGLARKLAARYARRYRRAKHGDIDLRRTVRNALGTGGAPVHLKYRKKKLSKPELVLLCDVSGSVAVFSEFMLQLVYTIQNKFRSVRSFIFVDKVDEITSHFFHEDIEKALQDAFTKTDFSYSGFSDYGKVFTLFVNKYLETISSKSTLIILGDARNNYRLDEKDFLQKIAEYVTRILWFNPRPRSDWDKDDSIVKIYAPYCRQVLECRNLKQLEDVIKAIL